MRTLIMGGSARILNDMGRMATEIAHDDYWGGDTKLRPRNNNRLIKLAYTIAVNAHRGTSRKNGEPYINHPLRVAKKLENYGKYVVCAALLHDVVEDTEITTCGLGIFFPTEVIEAIDAVTKREGEDYTTAIMRVALSGKIAILVKIADTLDNSSNTQLACFESSKRASKSLKYRVARETLIPILERQEAIRDRLRDELEDRREL